MTMITIDHVSKRLDSVQAVDNVSLKIASGDVVAILGPSGSGKSTLLRLIAGLIPPDNGTVYYDQIEIKDIPLENRNIGMVFQDDALVPHWNAEQSIGFWSWLRGRQHEVPERVRRVSNITGFGFEQLLSRKPRQLSGGEKQRVSIARALARDLRLLLFDEPFANLDAKYRAEARVELKRLLNEFPATAIYVTHDQTEAVALSHRLAIMRDGHIEQTGTFTQLYHSPRNVFVAEFIGTPTINLFRGHAAGGQWQGEVFGGFPIRADLPDDMTVIMGVRPEFIHLQTGGTPAVVSTVTPFFAEHYLLLDVWLGGERWQMTAPIEERIHVGETIYCAVDPEGILYFDAKSKLRIG